MVYFLFIIAQNNNSGNKRLLFTPSRISETQRTPYWLLPPITNERNYKIIIKKLLKDIFGTKRVVGLGPEKQYIKSYQSNNLMKIKNPIIKDNYPEYFLLNEYQKSRIKTMVDKAEMLDGHVLLINVFYYLENVKATKLQVAKGYCEYHKTMVASLFNAHRKTSLVYDEKTDSFKEKKEPIISSIFRSLMGNTSGGARKYKTRKQKLSKHKTSKYMKKNKRRHIRNTKLHNRTRKNRHRRFSYKK